MSERFISPGVFTQENDLSFLPQGISQIGAAFIGPTLKGPAFRPITVQSQADFTAIFGDTTPDFYTPYAVQNYLREANTATICRILGLSGYDNTKTQSLILYLNSGSVTVPVGVIFPSYVGVTLPSASINASEPTQFTLVVSGANGLTTYNSMSIDPTSPHYFANILGTSPTTNQSGYALLTFPNATSFTSGALNGTGSISVAVEAGQLMLSGSTYGTYREAATPWVRSQTFGSIKYNLFRFHTLSDGTAANNDVKISIADINPNPTGTGYGTFTVLVRDINDTDSKPNILEQYTNCSINSADPNYIAKVIGTSTTVIDANGDIYLDGDYPNNSKYVYVEVDSGLSEAPEEALPYGFVPLAAPLNLADVPAPAYVTTRYSTPAGSSIAIANDRVYYGFNFADPTGLAYLSPIPSGSINSAGSILRVGIFATGSSFLPAGGADPGFDLLTNLSSSDATDISASSATNLRKFSIPFQNGFDGENPATQPQTGVNITATNTQGFDISDAASDGAKAYMMAITALSNPDTYDINMLIIPGAIYSLHPYIVTQGIQMCENRGDCFYVFDGSSLGVTTATAVNDIADVDSNYAATYYPWVKVNDASSNKNVWVPPSVVMPNVYAFNDRVGAEWYAPAGLNRGGIDVALAVRTRLGQSDRDTLYLGRVNPIATFPAQGIVVWGQKTTQQLASALDRINVRRLLISVKKFIASTSKYLVFEQNVDATRKRFLSVVNPYLQSVQERAGLYAFKVVMDDTNNTPDIIDRNILVGQLYLQPTKTAEFISLQFNVLPTGATFPE